MKEISIQKLARMAGFYYLIIVIMGFWGLMYVPSKIKVKDDPAATMNNLIQNEFLFRSGTVSQMISSISFIFLVLVLYRIFKDTAQHRARLMVFFVLVQIPVFFLAEAFNMAALMVAKGSLMQSLELPQKQEFMYLLLRIHKFCITTIIIFWGLWLIPLGQLILKSGYLPRIIGILLIAGGWAYVIESLDYILLDSKLESLTRYTSFIHTSAELLTVVWLLIKGIKVVK
ncbi:MAG: DUF4386 domain-containing protein [Spirosomaceae bacterium]|jgi:hypothetical protein|nr:DUF4386 domain-containing protein [Spirosomataceae bacterium]